MTEPASVVTQASGASDRVLDDSTWWSLSSAHRRFGEQLGQARRYRAEFAPFMALDPEHDERGWHDLAALAGPDQEISLSGFGGTPPSEWQVLRRSEVTQMIAVTVDAALDEEALRLGLDDVSEILDLVDRTRPGPYRPQTVEIGTYFGVRRGGRLIVMAGERRRPPGWTEVSAVCTDAEYRGQGLASRLVRAVVAEIESRGERAFLHASSSNTNAIRLYRELGFVVRRETTSITVRSPGVGALEE